MRIPACVAEDGMQFVGLALLSENQALLRFFCFPSVLPAILVSFVWLVVFLGGREGLGELGCGKMIVNTSKLKNKILVYLV